jgi:hypothetical protein
LRDAENVAFSLREKAIRGFVHSCEHWDGVVHGDFDGGKRVQHLSVIRNSLVENSHKILSTVEGIKVESSLCIAFSAAHFVHRLINPVQNNVVANGGSMAADVGDPADDR